MNSQTQADGIQNRPGVTGKPEKAQVSLGFIPLTDCAPLAIAQEQGFFRAEGLDVALSREPSWANIRDKVCFGVLDGAQMLAGMPLALTVGAEAFRVPMLTAFSMNLNGNAITVSQSLHRRLLAMGEAAGADGREALKPHALRQVIEENRRAGKESLHFAMVFPFSSHNYLLRYWLSSAGIEPDRDIRLSVVPPPLMADCLSKGLIDGYCVGEPWNTRAVEQGIGRVLIASCEIWNNHPEKVFAVTREWAGLYPNTHQALLRALLQAARWLDGPDNRSEAARILARPEYVNAPVSALTAGLSGQIAYGLGEPPKSLEDFHVFHRYAANFPWVSHAEWLLAQMLRWGQLRDAPDDKTAASVYRPDLFRQAARAVGIAYPPLDRKQEGIHPHAWLLATPNESFTLGSDSFFDGGTFAGFAAYPAVYARLQRR